MERRKIFALAVLPLSACSAVDPPASDKTVQSVFAQIQYALILMKTIGAGIAILSPGALGVAILNLSLATASEAFQGLQATMSPTEARPIVQRVVIGLKSAVNTVADLVLNAPPGSTLSKFKSQAQEAETVVALINGFTTFAGTGITARIVSRGLPLLHR